MRKSMPLAVNYVLDQTHSLEEIVQKAILLARWERALKSFLAVNLHSVVRLANYRNQRFVIEVASGAWLTPLRQQQTEILTMLRQNILPELSGLDFIVNPDLYTKHVTEKETFPKLEANRRLSNISAVLIESLAKNCHDGLKDKLIKLAQHGKKTNNNN